MLASEQLKQQMAEAAQIAKEKAEPRKKEKAETKRELPTGRTPDLTGGVDIEGLRFPANVMMANSSSSLSVGNRYDNSMSTSGVIRRIVLMPAGYCYAEVESESGKRWAVVMPTGMTGELGA